MQRDAGTGWDIGAGWDFDDVRDHYLAHAAIGVDPVQLRRSDHARYLELSRAASGEVMAEVMGEWRRAADRLSRRARAVAEGHAPGGRARRARSPGRPKVAYHHLRRALAPIAVWTTDEGVNGVAVHVANDRPEPLAGNAAGGALPRLRVPVAEAHGTSFGRPAHDRRHDSVEGMLGRFVDAAWAYRFGPPRRT